ncbi:hypothetical protein [Brevibacterium sp. K72]|uniref:hypothetical protein n=1 Tax=Brevibacterium sp. K72 TaxID=3390729 RepID=UPI003D2FA70B
MPDETVPTHVLSTAAVRWSITTLGAQELHPTFPMYLYLRTQERSGKLSKASASAEELLSLIRMPGHRNKPYYFPLIGRGKRTGEPLPTFWRGANIPGSWSPGSLGRQMPWLQAESRGYAWPESHVERALTDMLKGRRVSAVALGAYFLRNDGFVLSGTPSAEDLIAGFCSRFDYPSVTDAEFDQLFTIDIPDVKFDWFDPYVPLEKSEEEPTNV